MSALVDERDSQTTAIQTALAMKISTLFRKPQWMSRDAAKRRDAVARDASPELVAQLARFAREDEDAQVRLAALRRLADPALAQGMARDDADAEVRKQARALWLDLLVGTHAAAPSPAERLRLLGAQDDAELIECVATQAAEPELRRAALERVSKPSLLFARASEDRDASIRLALVERIDDEKQLERLAERARKTDKQLSRRARERIEALRIARGDDSTLEQRARQLCERIEQLLRVSGTPQDEDALVAQWNEVQASAPAPLRTRFDTARALLAEARAPRVVADVVSPMETEAATPEVVEEAAPSAHADPVETAPEVAANLIAQARFAASLDEAQAARRQHRDAQKALVDDLHKAQRERGEALDAGASARAHAAQSRIDALRKQIDTPLPQSLADALAGDDARYAELARWQHWADNERRRQLCEELEALPAAGLHPDAVAAKVRDAQREWQLLDKVEAGRARVGGLARRFHAACRAAIEPAQGYFRKRQELREGHAAQFSALLDRVNALPVDDAEVGAVTTLRRETVEALRSLDRVEPRERKALAQSLKNALGALDGHVDRRNAGVEAAKSALIAQAQKLADEMPRGAVASARELQERWRAAGNGKRSRDQAQWTQFREGIDRVFAQLDAQRAERVQRDNEVRTQAEALCAELEAIAAAPDTAERGAVARIETAWKAMRVDDAGLRKRHDGAQARLREHVAQRERDKRRARYLAWFEREGLCRLAHSRAEDAEALLARWSAAPRTDIAAATLDARFQSAFGAAAASDDDARALQEVLIELETLAGIESPADERELRRELQVARLAQRMGGAAPESDDELAALLTRWTVLPCASAAQNARFDAAFARALDGLH